MPWTKVLVEKSAPDFDDPAGRGTRQLSYGEAIREALDQALARDPRVYVMGQGVDDPSGTFGSTLDLHRKHGRRRVFDTPLSENALTGMAVGSALAGMRPVYVHNRPDFLLMAMDQIANHAAKWSYMFGGRSHVPLVIRTVTGRGWGSAAQHSQALQGLFLHVPGLKIAMPATAYDAKGLLLCAIADGNPVLFLEHRWLYKHQSHVPEEPYRIPFGKALVRRAGGHVTIVAVSQMVIAALAAADELSRAGISAEVIDPRTLCPLDTAAILGSLRKTGRLVVCDTGWKTGGVTAELAALAAEKGFAFLKRPVRRVACPDVPTPAGCTLEEAFYPGPADIVAAVKEVMA
ncbi:MAG: alpha-ketoacid dehydrogenase subunit beta [Elusimicrobia bacterium]|nr:alpha-ketoacid dehydrogenase subunit beta [Elusimicrobiota bacterium]